MMTTWKHKAVSLVASFCLAFSMMPSASFAATGDESSDVYYGYLYKGDPFPYDVSQYKFALYCVEKDYVDGIDFGQDITAEQQAQLNDNAQVVYCMDSSKNEPVVAQASLDNGGKWPTYNKLAATSDNLLSGCTKGMSYGADEIVRGLAWVASNGYPNSTFQGDMSVSDYRAVTQWAVYYWTQGTSRTTYLKTATQKAAAEQFKSVPDDFDAAGVLSNVSVYQPTANLTNPQWLIGFNVAVDTDAPPTPPTPPEDVEVVPSAHLASFAPCAIKTLEGGTLTDGQFTFDLYENGNLIDTATNDADGNIKFGSITYTEAGTHTYTIEERNDAQDGITYDASEKTVTVKVTTHSAQTYDESATYYGRETYDYDEGLQYWIGDSETEQGIQMFCTNADVSGPQDASAADQTYTAIVNPDTIIADKDGAAGSMINSNRYGSDAELQENLRKLFYYFETDDADQFQSDMKQRMVWYATGTDKTGDGKTYKVNGVSVKAANNVNGIKNLLDAIYQTVEVPADYNLVFFLPTTSQIANNHPQPLATGFGTVVSYEAGTPTFTNVMAAAQSTKVTLDGVKTLNGGVLTQGQFSFHIEGDKNLSKTVTNEADGTIHFGEIEYTAEDFGKLFTYFITEVNGGDADVTYDTTTYKVTIELSEDGLAAVNTYKVSGAGESVKDDQTYSSNLGTIGDGSFNHALSINGETAYCFNKDKEWPENGDTSEGYVKYENVSAADVQQYSTNANKDAILKAVYNGYPYDAAGLKAKYSLNDAQMQGITQVALWVATEYGSIDAIGDVAAQNNFVAGAIGTLQFGTNNSFWSQNPDETTKNNMYKCFADMTGWTYSYYAKQSDITKTNYAGDTSALSDVPSGLSVNLYIHPDNLANGGANAGGTQNLLSVGRLLDGLLVPADEPVDQIAFENTVANAGPTTVEVAVSKTDLGGKGVVGARLAITEGDDGQGAEVTNWETEADENGDAVEHKVSDLEANKVYTLTETLVPDNFEQAESIVFKVDENGNVLVRNGQGVFDQVDSQLTMVDGYAAHDICISKVNVAGEEIPGAEITISGTELNGDAIQDISWTSTEGQNKVVQLKPGTYTFHEENAPEGYIAVTDIVFSVDVDGKVEVISDGGSEVSAGDGGLTVTDQYDNAVVTVAGTKIWDDAHNQDGKRPGSVTIGLYNGTALVDECDVTAANNWQYSFVDLPKYTDGVLNAYSVRELNIPDGYVASVDGYDVTNSHEIETIAVSGQKEWVDGNDLDARPDSIQVNLYADGVFVESQTVTAANDWKYAFTNLPRYAKKDATQAIDPATEVKYTVSERTVEGYVTDVNGADITNTRSSKAAVHVQKVWNDTNDADGIRPDSVKVRLFANGLETGKTLTLSDANTWHAHFVELDKYDDDGKAIAYTVSEDAVDGYVSQVVVDENIEESDAQGVSHAYSIVNTHEAQRIDLTGTKTWVDGDDANGLRPDFIVVDLYANGEPYASAKVTSNAAGEWSYSFNNLIKNHTGQEVVYTVQENTVPDGYATSVDGLNIVNTHEVTHAVSVSKIDLGGKEIEGARISISKADGSLVKAWESSSSAQTVDLTKGDYVFHEESAPEGYTVVTDILFSVDQNGNVTVNSTNVTGGSASGGNGSLVVTDGYQNQTVVISKTNINGTEELEGAQLVVKKAVTGEVVASWTSGVDGKDADGKVKTHAIEVQPGAYVLTETTAPNGYKVAESVTFTVDRFGKVSVGVGEDAVEAHDGVVTMKDDYADGKVVISKTDVAGAEIAGATLVITNEDGQTVDRWTSEEGKSHQIELYPGDYVLTETMAPKGYELAESIAFTVAVGGKVSVGGQEVGKVVMVDAYSDQKVTVSKVNLAGVEIAGAEIVVFYRDGDTVDRWTSEEGKSHQITLKPGVYVLHEEAAPNGYEAVTDITFSVDTDGAVKVVDAAGNTVTVDADGRLVVTDQYEKPADGGTDDVQQSSLAKTVDSFGLVAFGACLLAVVALGAIVMARRKIHQ